MDVMKLTEMMKNEESSQSKKNDYITKFKCFMFHNSITWRFIHQSSFRIKNTTFLTHSHQETVRIWHKYINNLSADAIVINDITQNPVSWCLWIINTQQYNTTTSHTSLREQSTLMCDINKFIIRLKPDFINDEVINDVWNTF